MLEFDIIMKSEMAAPVARVTIISVSYIHHSFTHQIKTGCCAEASLLELRLVYEINGDNSVHELARHVECSMPTKLASYIRIPNVAP